MDERNERERERDRRAGRRKRGAVRIISRYYLGANVSAVLSWSGPRADSHAREESSSNFEISGRAGLNVNTGIMLIGPLRPAIGTFVIRWTARSSGSLFAGAVYTSAPRTEVVQKQRRI